MENEANQHQNTPSAADLEAQIAADEAARNAPEADNPLEPEVSEQAAQPEPEETESAVDETDEREEEFSKRISRMAFEKRQAEKQAKELQKRLAELEGKAPKPTLDEELQREVERRVAEQKAAQEVNAYNQRANDIYQQGLGQFKDFGEQLTRLRDMGVISREFVESADETGEPAKVLYYLSKNLDEAERISSLPPHRMGTAMGKIAAKLTTPAPKPQSKAPKPIAPIGGNTKRELSIDDMPLDEYMRLEDERWANRRARR